MTLPLYQVDAFTGEPFAGNPAAVVLLDEARDPAWMQSVAAEMNLSETAFVRRVGDGFELRWFTPAAEVALCGHATLATAHVLWETGELDAEQPIAFETVHSGTLRCERQGEWIAMDFPADEPRPVDAPAGLGEALGTAPVRVALGRYDYVAELAAPQQVRALRPDFTRLAELEGNERGVIVTALSDGQRHDFVSRFFAPAVRVGEDPVTGSAHCTLGPYWAPRLGKRDVLGYQCSARGGEVRVALRNGRAVLGGRAVTVLRGELLA